MQLEQLSAKQAALEQAAHGAKVQELGKRHASAVSQLTQRLSKLEHWLPCQNAAPSPSFDAVALHLQSHETRSRRYRRHSGVR